MRGVIAGCAVPPCKSHKTHEYGGEVNEYAFFVASCRQSAVIVYRLGQLPMVTCVLLALLNVSMSSCAFLGCCSDTTGMTRLITFVASACKYPLAKLQYQLYVH